MVGDILAVKLSNGNIFEIYREEYPESPRRWDNLGTMVCWHRKYNFGDKHDFKSPEEFLSWWTAFGKDGVILSVYMYEHSGITIKTTEFDDTWFSGQIGYIYATGDTIKKNMKHRDRRLSAMEKIGITPETKEKVKQILIDEVSVYDEYISGNVYGYRIRTDDGTIIDSCSGYYGDIDENGILEVLSAEDARRVCLRYSKYPV